MRERNIAKFKTKGLDYIIRFNQDLMSRDPAELHHILHSTLTHILDRVAGDLRADDLMRVVIQHPGLKNPIQIPLMPREQVTSQRLMTIVEKVLQSNENFAMDADVAMNVITVDMSDRTGGSKSKNVRGEIRYDVEHMLKISVDLI